MGGPRRSPGATVFQAPHHAKLRVFVPSHAVRPAPLRHRAVARVGGVVARFFVRVQGGEWRLGPELAEHLRHLSHIHLHAAALGAEGFVHGQKGFPHKAKVLEGGIGLAPQLRFDHVEAAHWPARRRRRQRSVVFPAQIAF